jgi:hypothetical protein
MLCFHFGAHAPTGVFVGLVIYAALMPGDLNCSVLHVSWFELVFVVESESGFWEQ